MRCGLYCCICNILLRRCNRPSGGGAVEGHVVALGEECNCSLAVAGCPAKSGLSPRGRKRRVAPATRLGPSVVAVEPASALPREQPMLGVHANASCDGREANGKAAHEFWL